MTALLQARPQTVWALCAVCGEKVRRLKDGKAGAHVPTDPRFSWDEQRGYYCRGIAELTEPLPQALTTQLIVVWNEGVESEWAWSMMHAFAEELSNQGAVERVRVVTRARD